jgi:formylglycine-generating enzyme required for sulfatase activity
MVVVPPGSFTMGSPEREKDRYDWEGPQHTVTIARRFAVGKFHVTRDQYEAFLRKTGYQASSKCFTVENSKWEERVNRSWRNPGFAQEGTHPVVCVTRADVNAYVEWMAKETGKPYRLLSEAEFEYAARGRTSPGAYPSFWFGNDEKELCRYANFQDQKSGDGNAPCNDGYAYTSPAGHYEPNAFELYDMAGNASQFTEDCWHDNYNGTPRDGSAFIISNCNRWVVRGGSWFGPLGSLRAAASYSIDHHNNNYGGFRVARTLNP